MSMNLGINVVEVDGKAAPSIQGAPTSVAGFVIRSKRGVPGVARQVTNVTQFNDYFGGYRADAYGAYAVRGFFDNGGTVAYVTRVVKSGVAASHVFTDGAQQSPVDILTVSAGYRGKDDPGAWGNDLKITLAAGAAAGTFDLTVKLGGKVVETWPGLKVGAGGIDPTTLNNEFTGSKYIKVVVKAGAAANPAAAADVALTGGGEGTVGTSDFTDAFESFDTVDIQLLCCPESDAVVADALTYCAGRGDCMFVGHTAEGSDASAAKTYGKGLQQNKAYGALYFPFILITDPLGGQKWVPPTGHVMGVYARTERERGIWKAPAGNAAHVSGALDVKYHVTDTDHTDLVKNGSVNAVRFVAGQGIIVDSSRTLSTNTLWLYVNVRLLFNFVKSSLKNGLRWVVQEPNDAALWNKVKYNSVTPFLMGLWRRGAFGSGAPADVFTVKIDAENNPPSQVKLGYLNVEVYFYPSRPAETIVITVGQQEGGGKASES